MEIEAIKKVYDMNVESDPMNQDEKDLTEH